MDNSSTAGAGPGHGPAAGAFDARVAEKRRRWLVTGSAGFIGSHLVEALLRLGQDVVGMDNFATGHQRNIDEVCDAVGPACWQRHRFLAADILDEAACREACTGVDVVLHQAALGSVPRSLANPLATHAANATGFLNVLTAAKDAGVRRFVYASSSSVYGDHAALPKREEAIGNPLSPYAVSKRVDELYAEAFGRCYAMETMGLRYFNVFGARQDPEGPYAAVIPLWARALLKGETVYINGDGETSRDFCYVANAVRANLQAALSEEPESLNQVYNVAVGGRTTLNRLFGMLRDLLAGRDASIAAARPQYRDFRPGDVRHSQADIAKAERLLGYAPSHAIEAGLREAMPWYIAWAGRPAPQSI